jgi:hypothetical protein
MQISQAIQPQAPVQSSEMKAITTICCWHISRVTYDSLIIINAVVFDSIYSDEHFLIVINRVIYR